MPEAQRTQAFESYRLLKYLHQPELDQFGLNTIPDIRTDIQIPDLRGESQIISWSKNPNVDFVLTASPRMELASVDMRKVLCRDGAKEECGRRAEEIPLK